MLPFIPERYRQSLGSAGIHFAMKMVKAATWGPIYKES